MPAKKKKPRGPRTSPAAGVYSIYDGGGGTIQDYQDRNRSLYGTSSNRPSAPIFKRCREWRRSNWLVGTVLRLKAHYYNFGFNLRPSKSVPKKDKKKFQEWKAATMEEVREYGRGAWNELLLCDNLIPFWRTDDVGGLGEMVGRPIFLKPEEIKFHDPLGVERIEVDRKLSPAELELVPRALKDRYASGRVILGYRRDTLTGDWLPDPGLGEHYLVTKRSNRGDGLAWPSMYSVFRALGQVESMDVGEELWAFISRTVYRQWKKGHETRYQFDMKSYWTKAWNDKFLADVGNKFGLVELGTNFDIDLDYPFPDQKFFNPDKYNTAIERLKWWGGPVAFMLVAKGITPFVPDMLKTEAMEEREVMRGHLRYMLEHAFSCPLSGEDVEVVWGNSCFKDARLMYEMLKAGVQQGATSLTSYNEQAGLDPVEERERKMDEADAPDGEVLPRHDRTGHLPKPGREPGGRPTGTPDPK